MSTGRRVWVFQYESSIDIDIREHCEEAILDENDSLKYIQFDQIFTCIPKALLVVVSDNSAL